VQEPSDEQQTAVEADEPQEEEQEDVVAEQGVDEEDEKEQLPVKEVREPRVRRLDLVSRRNIFFFLSLLIIIPGIISMTTKHFLLGVDFAGGTETTIRVGHNITAADVQRAVDAENVDASVIPAGNGYIIRTPVLSQDRQTAFQNDLKKSIGADTQSVLEVGGTIAKETVTFALLAVLLASVGILLLLAIRFRNVPGGWRAGFQFGGSALAALLHDVFLLTGLFSIMGAVLHWQIGQIDSLFVTAVLTVVGFSVHDTIVVFDRIRENLRVSQRLSFEQVVNLSIMQTAARSIITSFTVVLVLSAIFISGGPSLQGLALALLIGIVSGTYSSIFNAAPLLVVWRRLQPLR